MSEKRTPGDLNVAPLDLDTKGELEHLERDVHSTDHASLVQHAIEQSHEEAQLGIVKLFKLYWPGAMWSMLLSLALVMEGMDIGMINNFFGSQSYINQFGIAGADGVKIISADWQAGISSSSQAGQIIGLLINGWAQSRYGSRKVYMFGMALLTCTIFILVFAQNLGMLLAGNISVCGIPWGIFQILTTAYAAECVPAAMRGYLTAWVSMCWGFGGFLASVILKVSTNLEGQWAWRLPYMIQWVWPVPLFFVGLFAPESPYWLVRNGRTEEAAKTLARLATHFDEKRVAAQLALIEHTNEMEKRESANSSYMDCFRGTNRRRTVIGVLAWITQIVNGAQLGSYATVFLRNAGMTQDMAFNYSMGIQSTNLIGTAIAIYAIGKIDRRIFYLSGIAALGCWMFIMGVLGSVSLSAASLGIGVAVMLILAQITFKLSLGPSCYTIVAETPSSRVRPQTMVIGRASYVAAQLVVNQLIPRMINSTAGSWGWGARCGFFWGACDVIMFVALFFALPETRGRTYAEIDYLFQQGVPARKFKGFQVDVIALSKDGAGQTHVA